MTCYCARISYDGRRFAGWQRQPEQRTVQGCLEQVLAKLDHRPVAVRGAGRTDAGVHARGQLAGFALRRDIERRKLLLALNANLPEDVAVTTLSVCAPDFDVKRDNLAKSYVYRLHNALAPPVLSRHQRWYRREPLDLQAMQRAACDLIGEHDFESFRNAGCQEKHARRCVYRLELERRGDELRIEVRGNAFVRGMVRILAGTLVEVGRGQRPADSMPALLAARDRRLAGVTAPPHGLTLEKVYLPDEWSAAGIPDWAAWPGLDAQR